jgi:pimeloyl-ACP methyl ester carboxylesterase
MVGGGRAVRGAERIDRRVGVRERVSFVPVGQGDDRVFMCVHEPVGAAVGSVLLCSSILADFLANYQREVNLARHLAAAGLATVRFHYLGTGNSDGDSTQVTLTTLQDGARWAAEEVRRSYPDLDLSFVGTRWGALTAAAAAEDHPGAPVVLCEPLTDFRGYYRDAMRSRAMASIASGNGRPSGADVRELIDLDGYADIVGNVIHPALYESTADEDAVKLLVGLRPHPALVLQFGGTGTRPAIRDLEEQLSGAGWSIESAVIDLQESWWFRAGRRLLTHPQLNESIAAWLPRQNASAGRA